MKIHEVQCARCGGSIQVMGEFGNFYLVECVHCNREWKVWEMLNGDVRIPNIVENRSHLR